ncbi:MAG: thermonuclease family protein [Myxococcales bacterium]|nr:thermonuclease family protein [Myxococcales bacterium]
MSMIVIKGTFHVKGYSPDGDSIKFKARDAALWKNIRGGYVKKNWWGHVQLRIEGMDAPETHFKDAHQPRKWGDASTDYLLQTMGFRDVVWDAGRGAIKSVAQDGLPGYILCRETDKYKRPIAFVFAGETEHKDGAEVRLDVSLLKESLNYKILAAGLAYPMFYKGLFADLRDTMVAALVEARGKGQGLWPDDRSMGEEIPDLKTLTEKALVFPKLFRRMVSHFSSGGRTEDLPKFLEGLREPVLIVSKQHFTHFDNVIGVEGKRVKMLYPPEDLVFLPSE